MRVQVERTIVTRERLVEEFPAAFKRYTGEDPEPIDVAMIYGKLAAECGHPNQKNPPQCCWNFNIGNLRGVAPDGRYCCLKNAYEFRREGLPLGKGEIRIPTPANAKCPPGHYCYLIPEEKQRFRAYTSLASGCDDLVQCLGSRFRNAWREIAREDSDPARLVAAMKGDGYFTGDVSRYTYNLTSVAITNLAQIEEQMKAHSSPESVELLARLDYGAATALRASEAEHTVPYLEVSFDRIPWYKRLFGKG